MTGACHSFIQPFTFNAMGTTVLKFWTVCLAFFIVNAGTARAVVQNVRNIRVDVRSESEVVITYDLDGEPDAQYEVRVFLLREGDPSFRLRLNTVVGDIGRGRSAGNDLRIVWNARADYPGAIEGSQYRFEFDVSRHRPLPRIVSLWPAKADQGGTLNLQIAGENFFPGVTTIDLGPDIVVNSVVVRSGTQLEAQISISGDAHEGKRSVRVVNDAERGEVSEPAIFEIGSTGGIPWYLYAAGGAGVAGVIYYVVSKNGSSESVTPSPLPAPPPLP